MLAKAKLVHRKKSYKAQFKMQRKRHEVDLVALEAEPVGSCDSSHEYRLNLSPPNQIDASRMGSSAHLQQAARDLAPMDYMMPGEGQATPAFTPLLLPESAIVPQPKYPVAHQKSPKNVSANPILPVPSQAQPMCQQTDTMQGAFSPSMGPASCHKPSLSHESFAKDDIHYGKAIVDLVKSTKTMLHGFTLPKRELPKFFGDPMQYHNFMKRFDETITKHFPDPAVQLQYLVDMCQGKAYDVVSGCCAQSPSELGLATARELLKDNFGRTDLVVNAHVKELTNGPAIRVGDKEGLHSLASRMTNALMIFQSLGL